MLGTDQSAGTLGVMPCAIAWLFKLINEQKDKTGARFSVRVSAVEVTGKNENLRDLLADIAQGRLWKCPLFKIIVWCTGISVGLFHDGLSAPKGEY